VSGLQGQNVDEDALLLEEVYDLHGHIVRQFAFAMVPARNQGLIDSQDRG